MRLLGIIIAGQNQKKDTIILNMETELSSIGILYRSSVKGTFKFLARESLKDLDCGSRHIVNHEEYVVYI